MKTKLMIKHLINSLLHLFYLIPVDNHKIYFSSFRGMQYSCNPKYIYECFLLRPESKKYKCVWEFNDLCKKRFTPKARVVKANSLRSIIELMTSKYIIINTDFQWWIPLRKNQLLLQTWHGGGAYKKVGLSANWGKESDIEQQKASSKISFYISSSKKFTEVQAPSKYVPESKFINTGMPRNILFFTSNSEIKSKVYNFFNIPLNTNIALYAPTYRNVPSFKNKNESEIEMIDFEKIRKSFEKRFGGKWIIAFRWHYYDKLQSVTKNDSFINATSYEDMQELLYSISALITDYSSSIWDFAITEKPIFLYAPDYKEYDVERGFYTPPLTWPGDLSFDIDSLCKNIETFNQNIHSDKCKKHLSDFGSFENKNAAFLVCKKLGIISE